MNNNYIIVEGGSFEEDSTDTEKSSEKEEQTDILIQVSNDRMEAWLTIMGNREAKPPSLDDVMDKLNKMSVVYGIDSLKIQNMIENKSYNEKHTIAMGTKPVSGENGRIICHFEISKEATPKIDENGIIDFKQLNLINNVKKGDLLAEKILPLEGISGMNLYGDSISAQDGKPVHFKKGKNTYESEDGLKLYAAENGQVLMKDGKIQVSQVYTVNGDVDTSTGNINFNGKVVINGNVKSGFTVEADGDIEVSGVVEGAKLIANGNIVISRGIQGNNTSYIECSGNITTKYVENAQIKAHGTIEADFILHSNITAGEKVRAVGKKGLIVGGYIRAGEEIRAKIIGSNMGTNTRMEVGANPEEKEKYQMMKKEIKDIEKNLDNLKKTILFLNKMAQNSQLDKNKEEMLLKSIKTYEFFKDKLESSNNYLNDLDCKIKNMAKGKIYVSHTIYPGLKVNILNAVRFINDELSNCTLQNREGEVVIGPYEG